MRTAVTFSKNAKETWWLAVRHGAGLREVPPPATGMQRILAAQFWRDTPEHLAGAHCAPWTSAAFLGWGPATPGVGRGIRKDPRDEA